MIKIPNFPLYIPISATESLSTPRYKPDIKSFCNHPELLNKFVKNYPKLYHAVPRKYSPALEEGCLVFIDSEIIKRQEKQEEITIGNIDEERKNGLDMNEGGIMGQERYLGRHPVNNKKIYLEYVYGYCFSMFCMSTKKNISSTRKKLSGSKDERVLYEVNTDNLLKEIVEKCINVKVVKPETVEEKETLAPSQPYNPNNGEQYNKQSFGISIIGDAISYYDGALPRIPPEGIYPFMQKNKYFEDESEVRIVFLLHDMDNDDSPLTATLKLEINSKNCFKRIECI